MEKELKWLYNAKGEESRQKGQDMTKRRRRRRGSNRAGILSISLVVAVLMIMLAVQSNGLKEKNRVYAAQVEELNAQIESEQQRTDEIEAMEEYKNTKEYVEEIAKDKLGLVYDDEILFKPEEN